METVMEQKSSDLAHSIFSLTTSECVIFENMTALQNFIKNEIIKIYQLRYITNTQDSLVLKIIPRECYYVNSEYYMIIYKIKNFEEQNQKSIFKKVQEYFGYYDKEITNILSDYRYPCAHGFKFAEGFLIKEYRQPFQTIHRVVSEFKLIFDADKIKQENYPFIKYLMINCKSICLNKELIYKEIIKYCSKLTALQVNFDFQYSTENQVKSIISILNQCQNILELGFDIKYNNVIQDQFDKLGTAFQNCIHLKKLTITLFEIFRKIHVQLFQLETNLPNLTYLTIQFFKLKLDIENAKRFGNFLTKCTNLTTLILDLYPNEVQQQGAILLAEYIGKCINLTKLYLKVSTLLTDKERVLAFGQGISQCTNLASFYLNCEILENVQEDLALILDGVKFCKLLNDFSFILIFYDPVREQLNYKFQETISRLYLLTSINTTIYLRSNQQLGKITKLAKRLVKFSQDRF